MKYYVVDAFADRLFAGNPAGVCVLDGPMESALMQSIAFENNLAETAFFYPDGDVYRLKWFTPVAEIDLCGHATLASAYVVMRFVEPGTKEVRFETPVGTLDRREGRRGADAELPKPQARALCRARRAGKSAWREDHGGA